MTAWKMGACQIALLSTLLAHRGFATFMTSKIIRRVPSRYWLETLSFGMGLRDKKNLRNALTCSGYNLIPFHDNIDPFRSIGNRFVVAIVSTTTRRRGITQ